MYPKYTKKNQKNGEWIRKIDNQQKNGQKIWTGTWRSSTFIFLWLDPESLNFSSYLTYLSPFSSLEETNKSIWT